MRALRLNSPNNFVIEDVEPGQLKPGWVRIHVKSVGVCGSDMSSMAGKLPFTKYPITPGHEFSGIVSEVKDCKNTAVGQYVTANPVFSCTKCPECLAGRINHCSQTEVLGVVNYDGAYAQELMLPEYMLEKIPEKISYEDAAMIEPIAVAVRAVQEAVVGDGSLVAIFGAGNIGLLVIQVAIAYGAAEVLVIEPNETRKSVARELGADTVLTPDEFNEQKSLYINRFDAIIDGVSIEKTLSYGIELGTKGGIIVVYGVPVSNSTPIALLDLFKKDMKIITSRLYSRSFKEAIRLLNEGKINGKPMITHRVSLEDFPALISRIASGQEKSIKVIVNVER